MDGRTSDKRGEWRVGGYAHVLPLTLTIADGWNIQAVTAHNASFAWSKRFNRAGGRDIGLLSLGRKKYSLFCTQRKQWHGHGSPVRLTSDAATVRGSHCSGARTSTSASLLLAAGSGIIMRINHARNLTAQPRFQNFGIICASYAQKFISCMFHTFVDWPRPVLTCCGERHNSYKFGETKDSSHAQRFPCEADFPACGTTVFPLACARVVLRPPVNSDLVEYTRSRWQETNIFYETLQLLESTGDP